MNTYELGSSVKLLGIFRDLSGVLFDPAAVVLVVKRPDLTETSFTYAAGTVFKASTGNYYKWISTDQSGHWAYKFEGIDTESIRQTNSFSVVRSEIVTP